MTNLNKEQIKLKLAEYCARFESQNKAANSMKGVSSATISQVLNNNWDLISDEMWRKIAAQIGFSSNDWQVVETRDFRLLTALLTDAQLNSNVFAVTGDAGTGKTKRCKLMPKPTAAFTFFNAMSFGTENSFYRNCWRQWVKTTAATPWAK